MNIILIGFKNCGKSTVGRALADKLQCQFIDTDEELKQLYYDEKKVQLSTSEIYQAEGENNFRQLEARAINHMCNIQNAVIASGGGSVLLDENIALFKSIGKIIYLSASAEELLNRQNKTRVPHFLDSKNPQQSFAKLHIVRKSIYEKIADSVIDVDNKHAPEVAEEILELIRR